MASRKVEINWPHKCKGQRARATPTTKCEEELNCEGYITNVHVHCPTHNLVWQELYHTDAPIEKPYQIKYGRTPEREEE